MATLNPSPTPIPTQQRRRTLPAVELPETRRSHGRNKSVSTAADHDPSPADSHAASEDQEDGPPAKIRKVSRACDFCKLRKSKCTGERPCSKCLAKGRECLYNARYTRGRPPTPPPSAAAGAACYPSASASASASVSSTSVSGLRAPQVSKDYVEEPEPEPESFQQSQWQRPRRQPQRAHQASAAQSAPPSRASPELGMAEIQGQVFDPTSGLTFLHRAWDRLSARDAKSMPEAVKTSGDNQHVTMAGDRPFPDTDESFPICLPSPAENRRLLDMYFDLCIATYRIFHRPSVERWLAVLEKNVLEGHSIWHDIGHARAAIVLVALAIAKTTHEKSKGFFSADDESRALSESDRLFSISSRLTDQETGYPRLESAQARIIQVLYLLTTSRFNQGWYVFGSALQLIWAIGLQRRENPKLRRGVATPHRTTIGGGGGDYIQTQCKLRTFWTAYILDNYLGVVFGRPRHFHDADIDQDFPDRINDEDMSPAGPLQPLDEPQDFHIDALIFHAKIGQIIGAITREVYTIKDHVSEAERVAAARRLIQQANDWRASLPVHLGSIRPSMLIPTYRRQATVLKLAYNHAIMHASRLFILGKNNNHSMPTRSADGLPQAHVKECIAAATAVLEVVDYMTKEGPIFHVFWWTHYVTFCALVVVYVWEIQQRRVNRPNAGDAEMRARLLELADKCTQHLAIATATNSPSRRYAVILEEFRAAAMSQSSKSDDGPVVSRQAHQQQQQDETLGEEDTGLSSEEINHGAGYLDHQDHLLLDPRLLDEWQTTDWLDLDSSAFWPNVGVDESMVWPGIG